MRYSDVETFLSIVRQKSLSKAATELFLAQSTVSQRLHKLEDEFGGPLVSRKQGVNEVVLTPKGSSSWKWHIRCWRFGSRRKP